MKPDHTHPTVAPARDGWVIGALALVLFACLRQGSGHGDGPFMVIAAQGGMVAHTVHFLYVPAFRLLHTALGPLGFTMYESAVAASALGASLGAVVLHRAAANIAPTRGQAAALTVMAATVPSACFYATVAEFHGFFILFSSIAMLAATRLGRLGRLRDGAWLGAATGLAFFAHTSAHLLAGAAVLFAAALFVERENRDKPGRIVLPCAIALLLHTCFFFFGALSLRSLGWATTDAHIAELSTTYFLMLIQDATPSATSFARTGVREWIVPYLPVSVLSVGSLWWLRGRSKALAVALFASLAVFLWTSALLIPGKLEHGAYFLPLAFPGAYLSLRFLPRRAWWLLAALTVACGITYVRHHDHPERVQRFVESVRTAAEGHPVFLLIASPEDAQACAIAMKQGEYFHLTSILGVTQDALPVLLPQLESTLDQRMNGGERVFLSRRAIANADELRRHRANKGFVAVIDWLKQRYRLLPLERAGIVGEFDGFELERRE